MKSAVDHRLNTATEAELTDHLVSCDGDFVPPLSERLVIRDYAAKIAGKAERFEAWSDGGLVGLVAAYCNDLETRGAYITSVSVLKSRSGEGIAADLLKRCIDHARSAGMREIRLDVVADNAPVVRLYEKSGFIAGRRNGVLVTMALALNRGEDHGRPA